MKTSPQLSLPWAPVIGLRLNKKPKRKLKKLHASLLRFMPKEKILKAIPLILILSGKKNLRLLSFMKILPIRQKSLTKLSRIWKPKILWIGLSVAM